MNHISLGDLAKDRVTGFEGYVYGIARYVTGCDQVLVVPRAKPDGSYTEGHWFDMDRLDKIDDGVKLHATRRDRPGGPATEPAPRGA